MAGFVDYNINLERERIEIPIYFSDEIDEDSIRDMFDIAMEDLLERFKVIKGELIDKS